MTEVGPPRSNRGRSFPRRRHEAREGKIFNRLCGPSVFPFGKGRSGGFFKSKILCPSRPRREYFLAALPHRHFCG